MNRQFCALGVALAMFVAAPSAAAVDVVIDQSQQYQAIDGFGAYGAKCPFWSGCSQWHTPEFIDLVVNELGVTMIRMEINHDFEPVNDNGDPNAANLSAFRSSSRATGFGDQVVAYFRALNEAMNRNGDTLKVICTIWSPPHWMKVNGACCGTDKSTNVLKAGMEEELAEFMAVFCQVFRQQVGIDLYGISMQNEPEFAQTFGSCYYSEARYLEVFRIVGRRFERDGLTTRLFGPEHVGSFARMAKYAGPIANDPEASQYLGVLATHGYGLDGATPGSTSLRDWERSYALAQMFKGVLWQTETGGGSTWAEAFELGQRIHQALRYGKISAWMHWCLSSRENTEPNQHHLVNNFGGTSTVLNQGRVTAAFARAFRPGAVQVASTSSDSTVQAVAFVHPTGRTLNVVLLNAGSSPQTAAVSGVGMPQSFQCSVVSSTETHAAKGSVQANAVSLPPLSITTLLASDHAGLCGLSAVPDINLAHPRSVSTRAFGLDGRRLTRRDMRQSPVAIVAVTDRGRGGVATLTVEGLRR